MSTPIPTYNSLAEIYAAVDANWPDNNTRAITELKLRTVVDGIVAYFGRTTTGRREVLSFTTGEDLVIEMTDERTAAFGQIPIVTVLMDNGSGTLEFNPWIWHVDAAPPDTTEITVPNPTVPAVVILH